MPYENEYARSNANESLLRYIRDSKILSFIDKDLAAKYGEIYSLYGDNVSHMIGNRHEFTRLISLDGSNIDIGDSSVGMSAVSIGIHHLNYKNYYAFISNPSPYKSASIAESFKHDYIRGICVLPERGFSPMASSDYIHNILKKPLFIEKGEYFSSFYDLSSPILKIIDNLFKNVKEKDEAHHNGKRTIFPKCGECGENISNADSLSFDHSSIPCGGCGKIYYMENLLGVHEAPYKAEIIRPVAEQIYFAHIITKMMASSKTLFVIDGALHLNTQTKLVNHLNELYKKVIKSNTSSHVICGVIKSGDIVAEGEKYRPFMNKGDIVMVGNDYRIKHMGLKEHIIWGEKQSFGQFFYYKNTHGKIITFQLLKKEGAEEISLYIKELKDLIPALEEMYDPNLYGGSLISNTYAHHAAALSSHIAEDIKAEIKEAKK